VVGSYGYDDSNTAVVVAAVVPYRRWHGGCGNNQIKSYLYNHACISGVN
jgi:hypothetical protein